MRGAWLVVLAGCGRTGFDMPDAALDAPADPCIAELEELGPWTSVRLLAEVSDPAAVDDDPIMTADGLELFFTSTRRGTMDVFRAQRAAVELPWEAPVYVLELSSGKLENTLELSSDALTMWLVSNRLDAANEDIMVATRPGRDGAWTEPVLVPKINSSALDRGPSVFDGDRAMLFHSERGGATGGLDWWLSLRIDAQAEWLPPSPFAAANTAGDDLRAWVSPCGLELYYQADRDASSGMAFFYRRRAAAGEPFGEELPVLGLDSPAYDQDLRLSPDRRRAVFSSERTGNAEIYEASR